MMRAEPSAYGSRDDLPDTQWLVLQSLECGECGRPGRPAHKAGEPVAVDWMAPDTDMQEHHKTRTAPRGQPADRQPCESELTGVSRAGQSEFDSVHVELAHGGLARE
jgi:hypothetical protein